MIIKNVLEKYKYYYNRKIFNTNQFYANDFLMYILLILIILITPIIITIDLILAPFEITYHLFKIKRIKNYNRR